jgi:hypothetical protein
VNPPLRQNSLRSGRRTGWVRSRCSSCMKRMKYHVYRSIGQDAAICILPYRGYYYYPANNKMETPSEIPGNWMIAIWGALTPARLHYRVTFFSSAGRVLIRSSASLERSLNQPTGCLTPPHSDAIPQPLGIALRERPTSLVWVRTTSAPPSF